MSTPADNGWSAAERALLAAAREYDGDPPESRADLAHRLIALAGAVFERAHRQHNLRKSGELVRVLRLFESEVLFPDGALLDARLAALWHILTFSRQRPVLACAGLLVLDLELEHRWSATPQHRRRALEICAATKVPVMPLVALESELLGRSVAAERLDGQTFDERRLRLVELIEVLDTYPDAAGLERLVSATFQEVFERTSLDEKAKLAQRLVRELEHRGSTRKHDRWTLMVDPLLLQNRGQPAVQAMVLELVSELPGLALTPYLRFYLQTVSPDLLSVDLVERAGECGVSVLPLLQALAARRVFWTATALARAAQRAIDAIVAREGLGGLSGGLTVVDGTEGALSVADAAPGPLSVGAMTDPAPAPRTRPSWVIAAALAVLAGLLWAVIGG